MWVTGNTDNRHLTGNLIGMRWTTFLHKPSEQAWITGYRHGTRSPGLRPMHTSLGKNRRGGERGERRDRNRRGREEERGRGEE